jgi:hypothetical protein
MARAWAPDPILFEQGSVARWWKPNGGPPLFIEDAGGGVNTRAARKRRPQMEATSRTFCGISTTLIREVKCQLSAVTRQAKKRAVQNLIQRSRKRADPAAAGYVK